MLRFECIVMTVVALVTAIFGVAEIFWGRRPKCITGRLGPKAEDPVVWASNQGVYNLFLFAGLVWGMLCADPIFAFQLKSFFLSCIILAGLYAAYSVKFTFIIVQSMPAAVALSVVYMTRN